MYKHIFGSRQNYLNFILAKNRFENPMEEWGLGKISRLNEDRRVGGGDMKKGKVKR